MYRMLRNVANAMHFGLCLCFGSTHAETIQEPTRAIFGVELNRTASTLLTTIERQFGKPVRQAWLPLTDARSGLSSVDDDGTPVIYINPSHGLTQDVIYHELLHFQLRLRGFPAISWTPQDIKQNAPIRPFKDLAQNLYDPILHYVFYAEVRNLDINPGATYERLTREGLNDPRGEITINSFSQEDLALILFKMDIEAADRQLVRQFSSLLTRHKKNDALQVGQQLTRAVQGVDPHSPESAIEALIICLNIFYKDRFSFEAGNWKTESLGVYKRQIVEVIVRDKRSRF